jgi:flagellar basal body-associated protein FliL
VAENQDNDTEELSEDDKAELEALLDDEGNEEASPNGLKSKKFLIICGIVFLILIIGGGYFFLIENKKEEVLPEKEQTTEATIKKEEEVEEVEEELKVKKVSIYKMEPFFLPLLDDGKETGQFLSISVSFLLSNSVLGREIDKVLPLIRKKIYDILNKKKPADFRLNLSRTQLKIKKEILTDSNALLLSGAGTINDVFFPHFMIK